MTSSSVNLAKELIPKGFSNSSRVMVEVENERWAVGRVRAAAVAVGMVERERAREVNANLGWVCLAAFVAAERDKRKVELLKDILNMDIEKKKKKKL